MKSLALFKAAVAASLVSLLAACGGGDSGTPAAPPRNVSFASAAIVVPANQSSINIALTSCTATLRSTASISVSVPVAISVTPTWVIFANGDMVVSAGLGTATSATEFVRVNDATAKEKDVWGSLSGSSTYLDLYFENADGTNIYGEASASGHELTAESATQRIRCGLTNGASAFTLAMLPSSARLVSTYLAGVTGTTVDTSQLYGATYTFANNIISWDSGLTSTYADQFLSFNVVTGELKTGTSMVSITRIIALSTTVTPTTNVYYEEWMTSSGNRDVYFDLDTNVRIYISKVGNALTFRPGYQGIS
jgi:hypothetical protein